MALKMMMKMHSVWNVERVKIWLFGLVEMIDAIFCYLQIAFDNGRLSSQIRSDISSQSRTEHIGFPVLWRIHTEHVRTRRKISKTHFTTALALFQSEA